MEATRQLVIDAAARHLLQRLDKNRAQLFISRARVARAHIPVHHQIQRRRMRKLRRSAKSAVDVVEHLPRRFQNRVNHRRRYLPAPRRRRLRPSDRALHHLCLLQHLAMLLAISLSNRKQHALETGPPVTVRRRKVSSPVERLAVGSKKRRKRPPTLSCKRGHRRLIPAVNIRTLVAIHLYRDVMLVDNRRHVRIVIRLAIHHMTPMTPDRSNIQEHRFVGGTSRGKCFLPKFTPLNRLMHRRTQIGRRSASQGVVGAGSHQESLSRERELCEGNARAPASCGFETWDCQRESCR